MSNILREIPKVDKFVDEHEFEALNKNILLSVIKRKFKTLRNAILKGEVKKVDKKALVDEVIQLYKKETEPSLKPLVNATGVILHTNMGRSPVSKELLDKASKTICNYSNLEYDIEEGKRGQRYDHAKKALCSLLGVEDALIVNNNASAVFLVLNTFAKEKEVIVSRGELVEIGGSFRVPEVMKASGAKLVEVGTTNKTKLNDYKDAIDEKTSMLMKVHKSNFDIVGFSEEVNFFDLQKLSKEFKLICYYDLGSGYVPPLPYNLSLKEPPLEKVLNEDIDLVSFSGDKLFGSVQAGIIVGKSEYIKKLKSNQLLRMLRVDKITLSLLQETILAYLKKEYELIPTISLLFETLQNLKTRAKNIEKIVGKNLCEVIESKTVMGGGTMPNRKFPTIALHIKGEARELEKLFRKRGVIGRIEDEKFLLDFRSIQSFNDEKIIQAIKEVLR